MNSKNQSKDSHFIELNQKGYDLIEKWVSDVSLATECLDIKELMREVYMTLDQTSKKYDPDIEDLFDDDYDHEDDYNNDDDDDDNEDEDDDDDYHDEDD